MRHNQKIFTCLYLLVIIVVIATSANANIIEEWRMIKYPSQYDVLLLLTKSTLKDNVFMLDCIQNQNQTESKCSQAKSFQLCLNPLLTRDVAGQEYSVREIEKTAKHMSMVWTETTDEHCNGSSYKLTHQIANLLLVISLTLVFFISTAIIAIVLYEKQKTFFSRSKSNQNNSRSLNSMDDLDPWFRY